MYIYFNMAKAFLETFSESGCKFFKIVVFFNYVLSLGKKMLEENGVKV